MDFSDIIKVLKSANHLLIAAHKSPDGDAIGAMVGLGQICKNLGLAYTILMEETLDRYAYLTNTVNVKSDYTGKYDVFVSLDCGDPERLGNYHQLYEDAAITVNIDHHITNTQFANYNLVDTKGSSTSELIFDLAEALALPLTVEFAQAIYTGLVTDTGGFMHSCTNPSTHLAAAKLIELPFDASGLYHKLIHAKSLKTMQLEKVAIDHLISLCEGCINITYFKQSDLEALQGDKKDLEGVISTIKNIEGTQIAALLYPTNEDQAYKLSLRSNAPYDVALIAKVWGGGGHVRAAGATISGTLEQIIEELKHHLLRIVAK